MSCKKHLANGDASIDFPQRFDLFCTDKKVVKYHHKILLLLLSKFKRKDLLTLNTAVSDLIKIFFPPNTGNHEH